VAAAKSYSDGPEGAATGCRLSQSQSCYRFALSAPECTVKIQHTKPCIYVMFDTILYKHKYYFNPILCTPASNI
jgi:hypothetical protein